MRAALKLALKRPSPAMIPLGSDVGLRYYHSAFWGNADDLRRFLVRGGNAAGWEGLWFEGDGPGQPRTLPDGDIGRYQLLISSYVAELNIVYTSPLEFLVHHYLGVPWMKLARWRLTKFLYRRKALVRQERFDVLRWMLEQTRKDRGFRTDPLRMVWQLYGDLSALHPDYPPLHRHYMLVLGSLADSGDVRLVGDSYELAPKALTTLSLAEEEDRRHQDNLAVQRGIRWLTLGLLIAAFVQAAATVLTSERPVWSSAPFSVEKVRQTEADHPPGAVP